MQSLTSAGANKSADSAIALPFLLEAVDWHHVLLVLKFSPCFSCIYFFAQRRNCYSFSRLWRCQNENGKKPKKEKGRNRLVRFGFFFASLNMFAHHLFLFQYYYRSMYKGGLLLAKKPFWVEPGAADLPPGLGRRKRILISYSSGGSSLLALSPVSLSDYYSL